MKKLTGALLSLMLFLGLGAAFAQTVPTPTFSPSNNSAVPPGARVTIVLPTDMDITAYKAIGVMYVVNNDEVKLETTATEFMQACMEDMGMGGYADAGDGERLWKTASLDNDDDASTFGMWLSNVLVPETATDKVKIRMRLVVAPTWSTLAYSDEFSAEYTIDPSVEMKPDAPTFTLEDNSLSIEHGYGASMLHVILYKVDGTDADFEGITDLATMEEKIESNGLQEYEESFDYTKGQTVKAVTVEIILDMGNENMPVSVSDVSTYVILPTPSFTNVGEVTQGDALEIEWPDDLDLESYLNWGFILYVENDDDAELEMPEGATVSDLVALVQGNGGGASPWAKAGEPAFKVAYYDGDEGDWPAPVALSEVGTVEVRARLAAGKSQDDDPLVYSDEFKASYTVKARPKPTAPTFLVNDKEVEGASVECGSGAMVGFTNGYGEEESEEYMIFYVINGTDADFEGINMTSFYFQEKVKMYIAGDEVDGEFAVTAAQTVKAATGQVLRDGSLWWSDIVTVAFTIKTVAQPVIMPDNTVGKIKLNQKVTITCANDDASIYYTLNGDAPTAESTLYEAPFLLPDGTEVGKEITIRAIAIEDGISSEIRTVNLMVEEAGDEPETPVLPETVKAPTFDPAAGEVEKGTEINWKWDEAYNDYEVIGVAYVANGKDEDLDIDAAAFVALVSAWQDEEEDMVREDGKVYLYYEEAGAYGIEKDVTLKARLVLGIVKEEPEEGDDEPGVEIALSPIVEATYTVKSEPVTPVALTFNPASGSEVEENTAVTITANREVEIFYMMFESEAAAKAAVWDQEKALSYSDELKPVPTKEKNTIKAAYALEGAEAVAETFFYATYKVKELPAIELTFNPADGSEVEDNTTVTVTANREVEIYYIVYADKAAADADTTFTRNAKEVKEDGMPVIKKGATYLRCGVTDRGTMKYFSATYKIKEVANEDLELAGVSVYPNPSNGLFNLELPVAATVEVFASNGVLVQRMKLGEGNATLNIERSGIYFLRITGEGRTAIKRVIVR